MRQTLIIILTFPLFAFSQPETNYQDTLEALKTRSEIDSIYAEHEFYESTKTVKTTSLSINPHSSDTTTKRHDVICVEKEVKEIGYRISTFYEGQMQMTFYFNKDKQLESKVFFDNGTPNRIDIFDEKFQLDYYFELNNDRWMTYSPKNDWAPIDDGWKNYEMIKAMILKR